MDHPELDLKSLTEAGRIARKIREEAAKVVEEGSKLLDICEHFDQSIRNYGARPAFPCNVGINEVAAHYTSTPWDRDVVPQKSIVKIDIGVEIEGHIADTAITVSFTEEGIAMTNAAEKALQSALKVVKPGVTTAEIGAVIQSTVQSQGFKPIRNLTGHEIARYVLHSGVSIPNVQTSDRTKLLENHVYAIEPFVTPMWGAGEVASSKQVTIFHFLRGKADKQRTTSDERYLVEKIEKNFDHLPYCARWLKHIGEEAALPLNEKLWRTGKIYGYHVLVEKKGAPVAQAEHTILLDSSGCVVVT